MRELCEKVLNGFLGLPKGGRLLIGIIFVLLVLVGSSKVFGIISDGPKTTLSVTTGGLPVTSTRDSHRAAYTVDVTATEVLKADPVEYEAQAFAHIWFHDGDPACLFTGTPQAPSSGRDCNSGTANAQCAFIGEGWKTYAVTGKSCMELHIGMCGGLGCI